MESVYLETTFISYLVARPARDLLVAAHQQATQDWWADRRSAFEICVSQVVIDEVSVGDPEEVKKRLAIIGSLPALEVTQDAKALTSAIMGAAAYSRRTPSVTPRTLRSPPFTALTIS